MWEVSDAAHDEAQPILMPGALEAVRELARKPVKLGIISNTGNSSSKAYGRMFEAMGIDGFFDAVSLSNELAMAKPSPDIFHHTLDVRWESSPVARSTLATIRWRTSPGPRRWA